MKDIYYISLCRNFCSDRRRLIYRDIYDEIYENITFSDENSNENNNLLDRMNYYINRYSNNSKCKIRVNNKLIFGEIDLIHNNTIIDFKCSESEFKLEWLIQLLIYHALYNNSDIKYLMIVNIMDGKEYLFDINYDKIQQESLIEYLQTIIDKDREGIRDICHDLKYIENNYLETPVLNESINNIILFNKKDKNNKLIFDTETSGFDNPDILQLAYIIIDENNNIIKKANYYIKNRISSVKAMKIHNITIDKLREFGKDFYTVINEFIIDLENVNTIIGHNLDFDIRVVLNNLRKYDIKIIINNIEEYNIFKYFIIYDTYKTSKLALSKLYFNLFNSNINNAHDALGDVEATLKCYLQLINNI